MARGTKLIGLIAIADTVKDGAAEAIARLKQAGIEPTMLTGDNRRTANIVAEQVGIENVIAIGRTSYRKTVQNLILAFAFNGIGIPLAATGMVHPIWAMVASASRKCWRVRVAGCSEWNSFIEARKSAEPRGRFCGSSELVHHLTTEAL